MNELPKPKPKKIDSKRFVKIAKKVKESFTEEEKFLNSKRKEKE